MSAIDFALATLRAWESKDANVLASSLSDDFVCRGFLPQPVNKVQYIDFMKAITSAFPNWSFNEIFLNEHPFMERSQRVLFDTITADFSPNGLEEILAQMGMVLP